MLNKGKDKKRKTLDIPRYGEIWLLKNPERIKELGKDYRPVLVISPNERNEFDNSVVILPMTTDDLENILPVDYQWKYLLIILRRMVWIIRARFWAILLLLGTKDYALPKK